MFGPFRTVFESFRMVLRPFLFFRCRLDVVLVVVTALVVVVVVFAVVDVDVANDVVGVVVAGFVLGIYVETSSGR